MAKIDPAPQPKSTGWTSSLGHDALASIVVFLVALPLCMGIALACGVPVAAGLIAGIIGGLLVAPISGAPLQVSGPAAGLVVVVSQIVNEHGIEVLAVVVFVGGILQLAAGCFRLGQWFRAVSPAVIHGMLSGIGVLIFASQFHVMVDDRPRSSGWENLRSLPEAVAKGLPLPDWTTPEERAARFHFLEEFGQLHERQVEIGNLVAEQVEHLIGQKELVFEAGHLRTLAAEQKRQQAHLEQAVAALSQADFSGRKGARQAKLLEHAREAVADGQAALAVLESEDVERVEPAQRQAQQSLSVVLAGLKNHDWAAKIGLATIAIIVLWSAVPWKKAKLVPAALLAVVGATAFAATWQLPVLYVEVPDRFFDGVAFLSLQSLHEVPWDVWLPAALMVAVIASAETLLCATAVDQLHTGPRANYDRELLAQGIGNMACGLVGGLPMTGVIVRSAANVQAGARTRLSAFLHGLWLLVCVVALGGLLRLIPTACLAGVLVYTGYKLINPKGIVELAKYGWGELAVYFVTVLLIVFEDLLIGVAAGIVLAALRLLLTFAKLDVQLTSDASGKRAVMQLSGAATFLRLPQLASELARVPQGAELHVDLQHLDYVDHACLDLLMNWSRQHQAGGGQLVIDWDGLHARFHEPQSAARRRVREKVGAKS